MTDINIRPVATKADKRAFVDLPFALPTAVAGISVTRPGTAPSMPTRSEAEALLARGRGQTL